MNKNIVLIVFGILLSVPLSFAAYAPDSFDPVILLRTPQAAACPCKTLTFVLDIKNNDNFDDIFLLYFYHWHSTNNPGRLKAET